MESTMIKNLLSKFSLFHDLNDAEMEKIIRISVIREWKRDSHIFMKDDPIENVYFVYSGKIKIYKSDINGREQIVNIIKNGDMFPHVGFFRKGGYPAFSEVMEDAILIVISKNDFENLLLDHPELCIKVFKVLSEKIIDLQERLEEKILNNTYEQIIKLLIRLARSHGQKKTETSYLLKADFTNKDLANMIGTTRETVSRTLTKLKKEKLVEIDCKGNLIIEPDKLLNEII